MPASKDASPPTWQIDLERLVLLGKLGQGAYGCVYRGKYDGNDVAVKVMDFGQVENLSKAKYDEMMESFRREAEVWSTLSHPNVTKFYGASIPSNRAPSLPTSQQPPLPSKRPLQVQPHQACVVAEFVPGGNLKDFLIKHHLSKLPLKTVVRLALDLARGIAYLHSLKVVHRDIKAENILLARNQSLKMADFGVARVEAANPKDMTVTTGTLGYMAPEVLDAKPYDHKADVYSFGICLWEIYCCDMPFPNLSLKEAAIIVKGGLRPNVPGICPKDLAKVMTSCWDAVPSNRPEMSEVVNMLEAVDLKKGKGMTHLDQVNAQPECSCFPYLRGIWG